MEPVRGDKRDRPADNGTSGEGDDSGQQARGAPRRKKVSFKSGHPNNIGTDSISADVLDQTIQFKTDAAEATSKADVLLAQARKMLGIGLTDSDLMLASEVIEQLFINQMMDEAPHVSVPPQLREDLEIQKIPPESVVTVLRVLYRHVLDSVEFDSIHFKSELLNTISSDALLSECPKFTNDLLPYICLWIPEVAETSSQLGRKGLESTDVISFLQAARIARNMPMVRHVRSLVKDEGKITSDTEFHLLIVELIQKYGNDVLDELLSILMDDSFLSTVRTASRDHYLLLERCRLVVEDFIKKQTTNERVLSSEGDGKAFVWSPTRITPEYHELGVRRGLCEDPVYRFDPDYGIVMMPQKDFKEHKDTWTNAILPLEDRDGYDLVGLQKAGPQGSNHSNVVVYPIVEIDGEEQTLTMTMYVNAIKQIGTGTDQCPYGVLNDGIWF